MTGRKIPPSGLKEGAITFYFLPIKDMGLTDELYIKMNSRGKPLTRFEHFKAELERCIRKVDEETANRVIRKIDIDWTDLLWQYRSSGEDEFDLLQRFFAGSREEVLDNISTLESFFDCWCHIDSFENPSLFLKEHLSHIHAEGKILIDGREKIDIFEDCLHAYADKTGRRRLFPLNRIILLYAIVFYLCNRSADGISDTQFRRRLRIINNLIRNSADEISDRSDRNRIPAILRQVDAIMLMGEPDEAIENNFNVNQLEEEREKKAYLRLYPDQAEIMNRLEDHPNLYGQISIIGVDHLDYTDRFYSLMNCNLDKIDCALMTIGNYGQQGRMKWRYQFASSRMKEAWDGLFHKSANYGFEDTSKILIELLSRKEGFTNDILQEMCARFITECEEADRYPWRYYYVKYPVFRPGSYGKLSNTDAAANPYLFSVMQTRTQWSSNTYMPYLKEADPMHLSREDNGQRLVYGDVHIVCTNSSYLVRSNENEEVLDPVQILQDDTGIDMENRIIRLKQYIQKYPELK